MVRRPRCCGRFAFWRRPLGPWCCTSCDRRLPGDMPANAVPAFWAHVDALVGRLKPNTPEQDDYIRVVFGRPMRGVEWGR